MTIVNRNHRLRLFSPWILIGAVALLIAVHIVPIYYLAESRLVSLLFAGGILGLILLTHLGAFGRLHSVLRKRSQKSKR